MLDLKLIRKNPGLVRKNLRKRESLEKLQVFEDLLECDKKWRESLKEINDLKHVRNLKNVEIARLKSKGQDVNEKIKQFLLYLIKSRSQKNWLDGIVEKETVFY